MTEYVGPEEDRFFDIDSLADKSLEDVSELLEKQLEPLKVKVESHLGMSNEIRENVRREIGYSWKILETMNVKGIDKKNINQLWEDRNMDGYAIIDLYLDVVARKQKHSGPKAYQEITTEDMIGTGEKKLPLALRYDQNEQSVEIFGSLGFQKREVERRFQLSDDKQALAMRYLAWLSTQEFMHGFRQEITRIIDNRGNIGSPELFARAISSLEWQNLAHVQAKSNGDYDMSIGYEIDAYNRKKNALRANLMMGRHIFFGDPLPGQKLEI